MPADVAPRAALLSWAAEARGEASSWPSTIAKTAEMGRKTEGSKAADAADADDALVFTCGIVGWRRAWDALFRRAGEERP